MTKYYRGQVRRYAEFWVNFRELPHERRFDAFVIFFKEIMHDVETEKCTLRDAGYALKPGFYDEDVYGPREFELSFADDAVEDLIIVAGTDLQEAKKIWEHIVNVMTPYL